MSSSSEPESFTVAGKNYYEQGQYDKAILENRNALNAYSQQTPIPHLKIASVHNDLGRCFWRKRQYDEMMNHFKESFAIQDNLPCKIHTVAPVSYMGLGNYLYDRAEYVAALEYFYAALDIQREVTTESQS